MNPSIDRHEYICTYAYTTGFSVLGHVDCHLIPALEMLDVHGV